MNSPNHTYSLLVSQNQTLMNQYQSTREKWSTDEQKSVYGTESFNKVLYVKYILFVMYYVSVILVFVCLVKTPKYSIYLKIVVLGILASFPFFIFPMEIGIYDIGHFTFSLVNGTVK
jgi:hypothetical protein